MASHEAWLGPFVADGLAEYLRFLQTGQPMVEYFMHQGSDRYAIYCQRHGSYVRSLCTIEVVSSGTGGQGC